MSREPTYRMTYEGDTFTRITNRRYTHVVLRKIDHAAEIARAIEAGAAHWDRQVDEWKRLAAGKTDRAERAQASLAMGREGYIAQARDRVAERLMGMSAPGRGFHWIALHWCGRHDLALRQAAPGDVILETWRAANGAEHAEPAD